MPLPKSKMQLATEATPLNGRTARELLEMIAYHQAYIARCRLELSQRPDVPQTCELLPPAKERP